MNSSSNNENRRDGQEKIVRPFFLRVNWRKMRRLAGWLAAAFCVAALIVWFWGPEWFGDPLAEMRRQQTPVRQYSDGQGNIVWLERTYDYQWRFDVPLDAISPAAREVMLAVEDQRFYQHGGIDFRSASRAFGQLLRNGRIVSGASTITMQLAGQADPPCRRTWWRKFRQVMRARKLERLYDKDCIFQEYLNRICFGGKIYGIEAAARYYYDKPAAELTLDEAALLCGIPQRPEKQRPDRYPAAALERQRLVLNMLERQGKLKAGEASKKLEEARRHFREFHRGSMFDGLGEAGEATMFLSLAGRESAKFSERESVSRWKIATSYEPELQEILLAALRRQTADCPGVHDGAAVLLDNRSGAVLALVGTLDFSSPQAGQVNAALASRVAGSTLKPFFYAEAIDGGMLVEDTILQDIPRRYGGYLPENYDRTFRGDVPAAEALSLSLNIPAVQLLAELGVNRMGEKLEKTGVVPRGKQLKERDGLAMALGTSGHNLLALTTAYMVFPRGGLFRPCSFTVSAQEKREDIRVFTEGTAAMVSAMLRKRQLPGCSQAVSWKTGTSNGNHDAWCFAYTLDYTLGVWFGNKQGQADSALVGGEIAAPCAGEIFEALYRSRPAPAWTDRAPLLRSEKLCRQSGLRPGVHCTEFIEGRVVSAVPLQRCRKCGHAQPRSTTILSPRPGSYNAQGKGMVRLMLQADSPEKLHWFLDGKYLGALANGTFQEIPPGRHLLYVLPEGENYCGEVRFSVE